jgi:peptidoglycan/xylan/chitin deacetylase (PgdA/CDA1 family)
MRKSIFKLFIIILLLSGCSKKDDPDIDEGQIIVLMYHKISEGEASNLYERSAADFENDLKYLIKNNINIISFSDLGSIKESGKMPLGHSAILSFDDGDRSWYDITIPLLKKYGMNATFFLWTEKIGSNSFLTWPEVTYMSNITYPGGKKPFIFGSHSYSHQFLLERKSSFSTLAEYNAFLDYELGKSKSLIEDYTPGEVTIMALPYGDGAGDDDIIAAARRNGYKFIRTSRNGAIEDTSLDLYNIPSLPMLDETEQSEIGYYLNN